MADDLGGRPSCERVGLSRVRKVVLISAGTLCLAVGAVGVVVPILPTTPFLILAALCYGRSSTRCYRWLVGNRVFGRYLSDYLCGRGIPVKVKVATLVFLWTVIGVSITFFAEPLWLRILLGLVALGVTVHVLMIKGPRTDGDGR